MKNYSLAFSSGLLSIALVSCAELQPVTIGGIEKPKVNKLSREGLDAELSMRIRNPNKMGVTIFPSEFDAEVNGISVGKVRMDKKVRIGAGSDEVETFHIRSNFSSLGVADIARALPIITSGSATVNLKGYIKAGKWYYKKKFAVDFTKAINLKQQ